MVCIPANRKIASKVLHGAASANLFGQPEDPTASPRPLLLAGNHRCQLAASADGCLRWRHRFGPFWEGLAAYRNRTALDFDRDLDEQ